MEARRNAPDLPVTVFERTADISYGACGLPHVVAGLIPSPDALVLHTPEYFRERHSIEVKLNCEAVELLPSKSVLRVRERGDEREVDRGLRWLLGEQEPDGSWFGRWGVNHVYGTGAALPALEACDVEPDHPAVRRAVAWLDRVQQPHGGFGEDILSYADPARRGRGAATPSQTAWALLGYAAAGEARSDAARAAANWLCIVQRSNGDWDEAHYTGTGFPLDFMIRYHLYRLHFPLMALGRLRERLAG